MDALPVSGGNDTNGLILSENMAEDRRNITWPDMRVVMGKKVESFGRWIQKPKSGKASPQSGFLLGVCVVLVLVAIAISVLTRITHQRIHDDRWDDHHKFGPYPQSKKMQSLVTGGYGATGVGLAVALLGVIMTFCRPRWLLVVGLLLCVCAMVLSLGIVCYGAAAHIFETQVASQRRNRVYSTQHGYNNYDFYRHGGGYYQNRDYLRYDDSPDVIEYYRNLLNVWKNTFGRDWQQYIYVKADNGSSYYNISKQYPPTLLLRRESPTAVHVLTHMESLLNVFSLLADAHARLVRIDSELVANYSSMVYDDAWTKIRCLKEKDRLRRNDMLDLYRGLMAMGTLQMLLILLVTIILGQDCCRDGRMIVVNLCFPAEEKSSIDTLQSIISENAGDSVTVTAEEDKANAANTIDTQEA